jgi:hypothetical protein
MSAVYEFNVNNNTQYAQLTGSPATIFNRLYVGPFMVQANSTPGGAYLNCTASYLQPQFWQSEATFHVEYNYGDFIDPSTNCAKVMEVEQFFGEIFRGQQTVTIDLDMISFATAFAVNIGILNSDFLETVLPVGGETVYIEFRGTVYTYVQNYDVRYPGMDPIGCIVNFNLYPPELFFCVVELGSTFVIPIFNSAGNDFYAPEYCDWYVLAARNVSTAFLYFELYHVCIFMNSTDPAVGTSRNCNEFSFFISVLAAPLSPGFTSFLDCLQPLMEMFYTRYLVPIMESSATEDSWILDAYLNLNKDAYPAQWYSVGSPNNAVVMQEKDLLGFCGFNCTMFTLYAGDQYNQATSIYFYQLINGSCVDIFESTMFDGLVNVPPTTLTESYYSCQTSKLNALSDAVGISFANISLLLTIVPFFVFPLLYLIGKVRTVVSLMS